MLTVPWTASRHVVHSGAEDVAVVPTAVTLHEPGWISNIVAHHADEVRLCLFLIKVVIFHDHRWVDFGHLLFVLDSVGGEDSACDLKLVNGFL